MEKIGTSFLRWLKAFAIAIFGRPEVVKEERKPVTIEFQCLRDLPLNGSGYINSSAICIPGDGTCSLDPDFLFSKKLSKEMNIYVVKSGNHIILYGNIEKKNLKWENGIPVDFVNGIPTSNKPVH